MTSVKTVTRLLSDQRLKAFRDITCVPGEPNAVTLTPQFARITETINARGVGICFHSDVGETLALRRGGQAATEPQ